MAIRPIERAMLKSSVLGWDTYEVYAADAEQEALDFLNSIRIIEGQYYVVVEVLGAAIGKDKRGIYHPSKSWRGEGWISVAYDEASAEGRKQFWKHWKPPSEGGSASRLPTQVSPERLAKIKETIERYESRTRSGSLGKPMQVAQGGVTHTFVQCPSCRKLFKVRQAKLGWEYRCTCGTIFVMEEAIFEQVECPNCHHHYKVTNDKIGSVAKCKCGNDFVITALAERAAAPAESAAPKLPRGDEEILARNLQAWEAAWGPEKIIVDKTSHSPNYLSGDQLKGAILELETSDFAPMDPDAVREVLIRWQAAAMGCRSMGSDDMRAILLTYCNTQSSTDVGSRLQMKVRLIGHELYSRAGIGGMVEMFESLGRGPGRGALEWCWSGIASWSV